jgi:DNA helicase HerA-like ATPase
MSNMKVRNDTLIGRVKSVTGSKISVQLDERIPSTMPIIEGRVYKVGQIGSFLRIPLGYVHLYGIVTQAGVDAIPEQLRDTNKLGLRWITLVLVGERTGDKFERGVGQYPTSDDEVHLVTHDDLNIIYNFENEANAITVGHISSSESLPASLDMNKLVTRHCALLGSTGSGKSNAVTVLLESLAQGNYPSSRIILIDPHGEYSSALGHYSRIFRIHANESDGEHHLFIPYWALPFNELLKTFVGNLNDTQEEYIREKVVELRMAGREHLTDPPEEAVMNADSPIPFSLKQLWYELDRFERKTLKADRVTECLVQEGVAETLTSAQFELHGAGAREPFINNQAKGVARYLANIRNRLVNQRFQFLYNPGEWTPDLEGRSSRDLDDLLAQWIGHDKPITILDLSGVPAEIMSIVTGAVIRIVYDALIWGQNLPVGGREQPLLLVLEEAHNYLQASVESVASRTVRSIAKEGRKYGLGLLLISQRPSELDTTILSQCGTTIALRMTNSQDRGHVKSFIQDDLSDIISLLPSLRTGEGLILGEAVHIPSRVRFDPAVRTAKNSDPIVTKAWSNPLPSTDHYKTVVSLWRKGKFR